MGGGWWLTINNHYIWAMTGNSGDGDYWAESNVGGAIAFRVPYSQELAERIKELKEKAGLASL